MSDDGGKAPPPEGSPAPGTTERWRDPQPARVRRSYWRWWIWSVPLAALILVAYLVTKHLLLHGPRVTVTFPTAEGVQGSGSTPVRFRGLKVGSVSEVALDDSLTGVVLHLDLDRSLRESLGVDTRFWIESPSFSPADLSRLLAGPYIGILPARGKRVSRFAGLLEPPPDLPEGPGRTFVLESDQLRGSGRGATIVYRGVDVGRVLGARLTPGGQVRMEAFVRAPYDERVRRDSRFWRCGGIDLAADGLRLPPLPRLFGGCIAFDELGGGDAVAAEGARFALAPDEGAARHPLTGRPAEVRVELPGPAAGLEPGSPVELGGFRVGTVEQVELRIDPSGGPVRIPARLALYPGPFGLGDDTPPAALLDLLDRMARQGLRARIASRNLLFGGAEIELAPGAGSAARLDRTQPLPELPAIAGGDLRTVETTLAHVAAEIDAIPFRRIGANLEEITTRVRQVTASPQIDRSLANIDRALADLASITGRARTEIGPTLDQVHAAVAKLDSAAGEIDQLVAGPLAGESGLRDLVGELTRTARSIRELADYLDQHPEALIRGRKPR